MACGEDSGGGGSLSHPRCHKTDGGRKTATDPGGGVRLPGQWYCSTPGSRRRRKNPLLLSDLMKTDDISDTAEFFRGGGGAPVVPSRISVVLVEETSDGDTS